MSAAPILLLGEGDLADEVRAALDALDANVVRLVKPTQREVADVFERGPVERAVVVAGDDAFALRAALMVRQADADVELLITYFDPTTARTPWRSCPPATSRPAAGTRSRSPRRSATTPE